MCDVAIALKLKSSVAANFLLGQCIILGNFLAGRDLLSSAGKLPCKEGAARHNPFHVVSTDVEVGHSIYATELYGSYVICLSCFLLSA